MHIRYTGTTGYIQTFTFHCMQIRSTDQIVLAMASSGIAALLLPGGRTVHSRFKVPLRVVEGDLCNLQKGTALANLIKKAALILWDEATMQNKYVLEAMNRTLQDIMDNAAPFGGLVILMTGDWRQTLPCTAGDREAVVALTHRRSKLWSHFQACNHIHELTENMRIAVQRENANGDARKLASLDAYDVFLQALGDGTLGVPHASGHAYTVTLPDNIIYKPPLDAPADRSRAIALHMYSELPQLLSRVWPALQIQLAHRNAATIALQHATSADAVSAADRRLTTRCNALTISHTFRTELSLLCELPVG